LRHGILWNGFHNLSLAHSEADIDYVLESYATVLAALKAQLAAHTLATSLRGERLEPVFRRTTKFHTRPHASATGTDPR
jgi:hypothetical protein